MYYVALLGQGASLVAFVCCVWLCVLVCVVVCVVEAEDKKTRMRSRR